MCAQHLNDPVEIRLRIALQLITAGTNRTRTRRIRQQRKLLRILLEKVKQLLCQHSLNSMPSSIKAANTVGIGAAGFNDTVKRSVDDRAWAA